MTDLQQGLVKWVMASLLEFGGDTLHCVRDLVEADSRLDNMPAVIVADLGHTLERWT